MSGKMYAKAKQKLWEAGLNWPSQDFKAVLLSSAYTADMAVHEFLDDLAGVVATSPNLDDKSCTNGILDCGDITFTSVTGSTCTQMVIYRDTGVPGTSPLVSHHSNEVGLPAYPNGGNIVVVVDSGSNKLVALIDE